MSGGAETHDGFFLRIGLGIAGIGLRRDGEVEGGGASTVDTGQSRVIGGGTAGELSIGGTPARGLVVSGTILSHTIAEPTLKRDGSDDVDLGGPLNFGILGASVDWYPSPTGGFHAGGTLGIAWAVAETPAGSDFDDIGGAGLGASLGAGYDWWVGEEWSLGVLGRFSGGAVHGEATAENAAGDEIKASEDSVVSALSVMFSILHH